MADRRRRSRADPPVDQYPGRYTNEDDVGEASDHPRDWFTEEQRVQAFREAWARFWRARESRTSRDLFRGWKWTQTMVFGDFGAKKTTLADYYAWKSNAAGHAVFSNDPTLFGWRLEGEALFTAMDRLPYNSELLIDEGSAALNSGYSNSTALVVLYIASANIRKLNIKLRIISAQDRGIAPKIRDQCVQAWRPVEADWAPDEYDAPAADVANPGNFLIPWDIWGGSPYKRADLVDSDGKKDQGFGPPDQTLAVGGEAVRQAFLLTDSFKLVDIGSLLLADKDKVKGDIAGESELENRFGPMEMQVIQKACQLLDHPAYEDGGHITPGQLARQGQDLGAIGRAVQNVFPGVKNVQRKGYPVVEMRKHMDGLIEELEAQIGLSS